MSLHTDLVSSVSDIFSNQWTRRDGKVVPAPDDLGLGNDGDDLEAAVLYADINGSTTMVDTKQAWFAAEIYKAYLLCAAEIIKSEGGAITAYDGDRVMAVFIGDHKRTIAARTALKINSAVHDIINPRISVHYPKTTFRLRHTVGIDCSKLLVARIGVRNFNDLVWVGRAANYAAKLSNIDDLAPIFVTPDVYTRMNDSSKFGGAQRENMWKPRTWTGMGDTQIYSSTWKWALT